MLTRKTYNKLAYTLGKYKAHQLLNPNDPYLVDILVREIEGILKNANPKFKIELFEKVIKETYKEILSSELKLKSNSRAFEFEYACNSLKQK